MLIRTYADIERLEGEDALSQAEKLLIENCKRGEPTALGDGGRPEGPSPERTIRADLLRYLILGGCEQCRLHEKGVQLSGAWVEGQLDLSFAQAKGAVRLLRCAFAESILADQASFDRLSLNGSSPPGLIAEGATIKGDVFLDNLKSTGEVSFAGAEIGGQLSSKGAELNGGEGEALNAQGAAIRGGAFLDNLTSAGEVSFVGAEIGGQLSAEEAELNGGKGIALNAQSATIRGGAFLDNLKSTGEVSFVGAEIGGQLSAKETVLNGGEGTALNAQSATIRGGAFLRKLKSTGEVSFAGAEIGVVLAAEEAELNGGEGIALNVQGATIRGSAFLRSLKSIGEVSFSGAEIGGQLSCNGAELNGGEGKSLNAQGATVRGGVYLRSLKSAGEVSFLDAQIGGQLSCAGAELRGGEGEALNARGSKIKENVILRQLRSFGEVSFSGAEIGGCLLCEDAAFDCSHGYAFDGTGMIVKDAFLWRGVKSVAGTVDLYNAHIGDILDDEQSWKLVPKLILVGMTYKNLIGPLDLPFRKVWLRSGLRDGEFRTQPYKQLAKIYGQGGHYREQREVLIGMEIEQRKAARVELQRGVGAGESVFIPYLRSALHSVFDWTLRLLVGYGHKPWLRLWWLAAMISIMSPVAQLTWNAGDFAPNSAVVLTSAEWRAVAEGSKRLPASKTPAIEWADVEGQDYETFFAFAYAVDVVVPVLDLGQANAWAPSPARGNWGTFLFYLQKLFAVLGWAVTAIVAADISGMIRRDD